MRKVTLWRQYLTLLRRNMILKIRLKSMTIQELLMPIYFVVLLAILKTFAYKPTRYDPMTSENITTVDIGDSAPLMNVQFFVAPNLPEAERLLLRMNDTTLFPNMTYKFFNSQAEMDSAYKNATVDNQKRTIGIFFPSSSIYEYALRFMYDAIATGFTDFSQGHCRATNQPCPSSRFLTTGFAKIQASLDSAIAAELSPGFPLMNVSARIMPKDATLANTEAFNIVGPLYMVWALVPFMSFLLVSLVYEKEQKLKEGMKMMGLDDLAFWFSWGTVYVGLLFIMSLIMTIIGYFGNLFPLSNFFLIFLLIFLYGISIEMFTCMITPFFSKARSAGGVGSFLPVILALIYLAIEMTPDFPEAGIWAVSLLSPTAFAFAMGKVFYFEVAGSGAHFYNLTEGPNPLYIGLVMITVDIFLYFILTLYLDNVIPGEHGRKRSPFYCLKPSFWCRGERGSSLNRESIRSLSYNPNAGDIEPPLAEWRGQEAIILQNVSKVFDKSTLLGGTGTKTVAVKSFTLDIYKGQITALLGHNGAGKTTLFNILTGFTAKTSGNVLIYDYDVSDSDDMEEIRRMTGVCPQHDILHQALTVKETLDVFAGIKGFVGDEKEEEISKIVHLVGLDDQVETLAKHLSGGQKRKLSVGISILGDPKILILDEPTAGMDPYSRRKLWDLLRSRQEDRVTLLTTHFMDEADILADRKAILSQGKLRCVGSSLFLKNRFGCGYHLGIVTKSHEDERAVSTCVNSHIENAELQRSVGLEHMYTLPLNQVSNFSKLFGDLDQRQEELSVQSYGVSMTTLEEVFLKIGEEEDVDEEQEANNGKRRSNDALLEADDHPKYESVGYLNPAADHEPDRESVRINVNGGTPVFDPSKSGESSKPNAGLVFWALVKRAMFINFRNPSFVIFTFILPTVLVVVGVYVLTLSPTSKDSDDPSLIDLTYKNNLNQYDNKEVLYNNDTGSSLENFVTNAGVPVLESSLSDQDLLTKGFYPHSVGLKIASFSRTQAEYTAYYNTSYVRSLPSAINAYTNSLVSYLNGSASNIVAYSKAWPKTDGQAASFNGAVFGGVFMVAMSLVIRTAFSASYPVKERERKIRAQLRVSGVRFSMYWWAWMVVDYAIYLIIAIVAIVSVVAFQVAGLSNGGAVAALVLLFIGWGFSCIMTSYCGSFLFDRFETVQGSWSALVNIFAILPFIVVSTLDMVQIEDAAKALNVIFVIINPYYIGFSGVYYCQKIYITYLIQGKTEVPASAYFDWSEPMVPFAILMAYVDAIVFYIILMIADISKHGGQIPFFGSSSKINVSTEDLQEELINGDIAEAEDDDVMQERTKVSQIARGQHLGPDGKPVVLIEGLRKEFTKRTSKSCQSCRAVEEGEEATKVAVRNLAMTVYPGEVVGLLGPNGAGKTTALNVLIADIGATKGRVSIAGHPVSSTFSDAFRVMGYCPQVNPLWGPLTLQEHLELYSAVRGVPKERIDDTVNNFIDALDIREHANKRTKMLSGGTQRKLCFAIAMLGNPQVVLLDEPSTGMDPKTKRFLWNTISTAFEGSGRGAILTTHYMEEADALCTRVGIMVLGHLKCIGSTQHLKGKFGQGYLLEVKLEQREVEDEDSGEVTHSSEFTELHDFVKELFPNVDQPEKFGSRLTYKIKKEDVTSLAKVFAAMEEAKPRLRIEEYSFSQSTLEQVFLRFAKEQAERDEEEQRIQAEKKRAKKKQSKC